VKVNENWRLTFAFEGTDAVLVDCQDYHQRQAHMSRMHNPPHPGEVLVDTVLGNGGLTVTEFARRLGVSRVALSRVVNGRAAISAEVAIRLAAALGGSAESWLNMQVAYDLLHAKKKPRPKIARLAVAA
jgi:antitoxin HigA-1